MASHFPIFPGLLFVVFCDGGEWLSLFGGAQGVGRGGGVGVGSLCLVPGWGGGGGGAWEVWLVWGGWEGLWGWWVEG